MTTVQLKAISLKRPARKFVPKPSMAAPNLTLSLHELIQRSQVGTMSQQTLNGVFYNGKHPELDGWENMDKVQKMQAMKSISDKAIDQLKKVKTEIAKAETEKQEKQIAEIKQLAVQEHLAAEAKKL